MTPNIKVISKRRPSRVDAKASITLLISNNYIAIFLSVFLFIFWNMSIRAIGISQAGISILSSCPLLRRLIPGTIKREWLVMETCADKALAIIKMREHCKAEKALGPVLFLPYNVWCNMTKGRRGLARWRQLLTH